MPVIEIGLIVIPASSCGSRAAVRVQPLDQLGRVGRALLELDPDVEILGVLAHDDEVDVLVARAHARVRLARPHLRVEVEPVAQRDVDGAEALADRRRDRALQRDAVAADRLERRLGQRVAAVLVHHVRAGGLDVPLEVDAGRLEHAARRLGELRAGAVSGDECHDVRHEPAIVRTIPHPSCLHLQGIPRDSRAEGCASVRAVNDFRPGLEGVIAFETEIAEPDKEGSALRYRGVDIEELVGRYPFEKVWGLLVDSSFEPGMPKAERIELQDPSGSVMADLQAALATLGPKWGLRQLVDIERRAGARRSRATVGGDAVDRRAGRARRASRPCRSRRSTRARTWPRSS